jgi:hypothetical protein
MRLKHFLLSASLLVLLAGVSAAASKMWVHVHVQDSTKEETVKINLPISVIETMLPIIEQKKMRDGQIKINESEFRVEDLRKVWNDIRDEGDMEFVSVQGRDSNVRVYIQGNYLLVQPEEKHKKSKVDIRIPLKVVDAMLFGKGNQLNLTAAVKALRDSGVKDIITVTDEDTSVRVWIDDKNLGK